MYFYNKILIWQFCCIALALSQIIFPPKPQTQFPPKHPVPANLNDPCAKFNGVAFENLPEWFVNDWYDQRCFDCCPPNGEYVRYEFLDDGVEDCSTGRDEWIFTDYKFEMYQKSRGEYGKKILMAMLSPKCLPKEKDIAQAISKMSNALMNEWEPTMTPLKRTTNNNTTPRT